MAAVAIPAKTPLYPRNLPEFNAWFKTEDDCRAYLENVRWPKGFVCPSCGVIGEPYRVRRQRLRCRVCRAETSVIAGTLFEDTKLPVLTWFQIIWLVVGQKHGTSALDLSRMLGINYETAWVCLHKLRRAMIRAGRSRLSGEIEVDETYVGGVKSGPPGRGAAGKAIVVIAVEALGVGKKSKRVSSGRIRLERVPDVTGKTLTDFVWDVCAPRSVIYTDGWAGYNGLKGLGFDHHANPVSTSGSPAHVSMPRVHRVASLLKRWLLGTHQGGVKVRHLDFYLDEFVFRFNRRTSGNRGLLFYRLVHQAVETDPKPAALHIVGGRP